jgi:hypothetical protein
MFFQSLRFVKAAKPSAYYLKNMSFCLYSWSEIQISYNIFGFKSKILIIFLDFNRNFFIFAPKMS